MSRSQRLTLPLILTAMLLPLAASRAHAAPLDLGLEKRLARIVLTAQSQPEQAQDQLQALREEAIPIAQLPRLLYAQAQVHLQAGDTPAALGLAETLARDPATAAQAQLLRAGVAARLGQTSEAALAAQRGLEQLNAACKPGDESSSIASGACDFRSAWAALAILSEEQLNRGAFVQAWTTAKRALSLAEAGGDAFLGVSSANTLAVISVARDQRAEAHQWLDRALQRAENDTLLRAHVKTTEAVVAGRSGDKAGQLKAQQEGLALATEAGAVRLVARAQNNLADYYMHRGDPRRALQLAREALPVFQRFKDLGFERTLRHNMSVILLHLGQVDAARKEIARVEELRRGQADTTTRIRELRELGETWADIGQPKEATALFHAERQLTAEANARNREASLEQLKLKYDSDRERRDLDLLTRDRNIKDQQLGNRRLATQVGIAVAVLLGLSLLLAIIMVKRAREANKKLKASQALLRAQSERDPLTDLANRRHFLAVMEQQQQLHAQAQFSGALLMIDIDHFKHVNDEHGHGAGDVVICEVARRLAHAVRSEDLVVRWGGEEFLVFSPDVSPEQLAQLAERILHSVGGSPVVTEAGALRITVSMGFAHFPLPPMHLHVHWEQAVNWADMALYVAKARGRNRAVGIATVDARDTDALTEIAGDFDAACRSERVSLTQVVGPA